ncbi:MAG: DUF3786 domain-containing protein [Lachnospiraceae bacterium]
MKKTSNYEQWIIEWKKRFLSLDQQNLLKKIPSLKTEGEFLTLYHFDRKFGVHKTTGEIVSLEDTEPVTQNIKLNIYTFFWYSSPVAFFMDDWVSFASLKSAGVFGPAFQTGIHEVLARTFAGHTSELSAALEAMGGHKLSVGDVGYEISAFHEIPMRIIFWDKDEEFPAQANLLFDRSASQYIHVESIVTIASVFLERLSSLSGLPLQGSSFNSPAE